MNSPIDSPDIDTHIHELSHYLLGTGTVMKILWATT